MVAATLRLRLMFDDGRILSKSQKKDGLKRSWLLLKPHHQTISDVVSYLLHHFDLYDACPNGIIFSMDGFILPPFESTAILKDGDLIRVKKKETGSRVLHKAIEGAKTYIDDVIVDKEPLPCGMELLVNEEYDKENGCCESETDVDEGDAGQTILPVHNPCSGALAARKRKAPNRNDNPKTKRQCQRTPGTVHKKHDHCEPIRTPKEKRKLENGSKQDPACEPKVPVNCTKNLEPTSNSNECIEPDANRERPRAACWAPDGAKKVSRSTRRKSLQRKWKREHKDKIDKCEKQLHVKDLNVDPSSKKAVSISITGHQQADEDSDAEVNGALHIQEANVLNGSSTQKSVEEGDKLNKSGWYVHSTEKGVWKGHSSGKNGSSVQKNKVRKETSQWNGITTKRKGQKWGTEKQPAFSWKESRAYKVHSSGSWATRRQLPGVDFEKLVPLIDLPKAGDIVAYRLLELSSSSWCPQLSSFRIGKISWFEPESNRIMLVPDPEYPLGIERKEDGHDGASGLPPESSIVFLIKHWILCSFQIDFPSLVDVRIVKRGDLNQSEGTGAPAANATPAPSGTNKRVNETQGGSKNVPADVCNGELHTQTPGNVKKDVWEEISEALSAKKAQLTQEDSWNKKKVSSSNRSWTQRTLRGSALSPTMAMLRAKNGT
ncbi:hypothetical protein Cgig2_024640 [Carnegiea gigantea]|uniref:Coilin n=1 Tax=Carnegiea gigantea TaxID=171969 RepID=A0A9Q1K734_9CARY|nr:hypothetical protein Cgig2_024640 [Carnegiea gigantea]